MIEITGLTQHQKSMLDYMWEEIDSIDEFEQWIESLEHEDKLTALTLSKLIMLAVIDEQSYRLDYYPEADQALEKYYN